MQGNRYEHNLNSGKYIYKTSTIKLYKRAITIVYLLRLKHKLLITYQNDGFINTRVTSDTSHIEKTTK
jgi:hypothetical protein